MRSALFGLGSAFSVLFGLVATPQIALAFDAVPFDGVVTRHAPAGLHMVSEAPLSVTVGGTPVPFTQTDDGVYSGTVSGVTATATFKWYAAAQAMTWSIGLENGSDSASPDIIVAPMILKLDSDSTSARKIIACAKTYRGAAAANPFLGQQTNFNTPVATYVRTAASGSGGSSSLVQVAMSNNPSSPDRACDEQQPNDLAGLYAGLSWSAGWTLSVATDSSAPPPTKRILVSLSTDQASAPFNSTPAHPLSLAGKEKLAYPAVNLGFATGSTWNDISKAQVNYVRSVLQPKRPGQRTASPPSYDSYFGVAGAPPMDFLRQQARTAAALGIKYFTIDAGWYQSDGTPDYFPGLGNYLTPSIKQYPQGQDSLADFCKNFVPSLGMKCGIWIVPQAAASNVTDQFILDPNGASNWASDVVYGRQKLQLQKLSAQDWAVEFIDQIIEAYGLGWIRLETQTPATFLTNAPPYSSLQYTNGVTSVFQRVRAEHPDIYIEASQYGGQRMDFATAGLAHGDWTRDASFDPIESRLQQTLGLRMWPASFLNLTDAGCTPPQTYGGLGCDQAGTFAPVLLDNVGDQYKVLSRMPGKFSLDGYISQWADANVAKIRALVAAYAQINALQEEPATFPLPQASNTSWDAVAFGGAASAPGVTPTYAASPGQALYVFNGTDAADSKSFCLPKPAKGADSFTLISGPDAGGASIDRVGPCPTSAGNYIAGGDMFTVALPQKSGALFLRDVTNATAVPAPSKVLAVQNDQTMIVTWANGSGTIAGSQISRSADNGATWTVIGAEPGLATRYIDAAIAPGATYLYRVAAYDASIANKSTAAASPAVVIQSAATITTVYDTDPAIRYSASGTALKQRVLSPMPHVYGTAHGIGSGGTAGTATYSCRAACTRLVWKSRPGVTAANASATVTLTDASGAVVDTRMIDTAAPAIRSARGVYDSGSLAAGGYTLTIAAAAGQSVELDSIDVTALVPTLIDDAATLPAGDTLTFTNAPAYTNVAASRGYFGATSHAGTGATTSFTYTCADCTEIAWLSHTGPSSGSATVALDGVNQTTVSSSTPSVSATSTVQYSTGPLPLGAHRLTVSNVRYPLWLEADAFQVVRPQPGDVGSTTVSASAAAATTSTSGTFRIDDAAAGGNVTYANMSSSTNASYIGGSAHLGNNRLSSFTYTCTDCTEIRWLGVQDTDGAKAKVSLDGGASTTVPARAAPGSNVVYTTGALPSGKHILTVTNAVTGPYLVVDAFEVVRSYPGVGWANPGFTSYTPNNAPSMTAANFYQQASWATASTVADGSVKAAYTCSLCDRLQLVAGTAPNLGIANVTLTDEAGTIVSAGIVDLYTPTRQPAGTVFDSGLLSGAPGKFYTMTVTPTGTKNAAASDGVIEVQAVRITKPPVVAAWRTANGGAPPTP